MKRKSFILIVFIIHTLAALCQGNRGYTILDIHNSNQITVRRNKNEIPLSKSNGSNIIYDDDFIVSLNGATKILIKDHQPYTRRDSIKGARTISDIPVKYGIYI